MTQSMLKTQSLPYCKGCGHDLIAKHSTKALEELGFAPLDVIMVTDIGCHGIIDKCMNTHTVHGLHGRSAALGAGIFFGLEEHDNKKVVVFIGDGGATIGLQHIMEAARLNLDITVVVHNNFLYGMTGGQTSGLTPHGFRTTTSFQGNPFDGYDICKLTHTAGARYVSRVLGIGDISADMKKAFDQKGFSLVEVMEICPSYGVKLNPKRKLKEIVESAGKEVGEWVNEDAAFKQQQGEKVENLLDKIPRVPMSFDRSLNTSKSLVLSGSAGEGVQLAANLLAKAAMLTGLHVTQKGSYPVTVGVGFSTAEVNLSPEDIHFHGISVPDMVLITSQDGLNHNKSRISQMTSGKLFIDSSLELPETGAEVIRHDFRGVGARNAAIHAILYFAKETGLVTQEAIYKALDLEGKSDKIPLDKIKKAMAG